MNPVVDISIEAEGWAAMLDAERTVREAVSATLAACDAGHAEVSVALIDDSRMQDMNGAWRGQDKPTNVLSFPAPESRGEPRFLGDIAIAFETTAREAADEAKPLAHHVAHLAVHGTLHLLGFDHENDSDAEIMEARERAILAQLGIPDPYASATRQTETA